MIRQLIFLLFIAIAAAAPSADPVLAQSTLGESRSDEGDGQLEPSQRVLIRFVTTDDFPPFNVTDEDGVLTGFNIDLARAICADLQIACDIRAIPWAELLKVLEQDSADAVIAGHRITAKLARRVAFTSKYFYTPARFAVRRDAAKFAVTPSGLDGRSIAVVRGSAHEAYVVAFFRGSKIVPFDTPELARQAVQTGKTDVVFDDGIGLVFWANGTLSKACCALRGGPYFEPRYFGDGLAMLVRRTDQQMRKMLNRALQRLQENGRMQELVDRYFPIRVY